MTHKPMHPPTLEEDFKAMERGLEFFSQLREAQTVKSSDPDYKLKPLSHDTLASLLHIAVDALEARDIALMRLVEKAHGIV